jgi:hypothetical protein
MTQLGQDFHTHRRQADAIVKRMLLAGDSDVHETSLFHVLRDE